MQSYEKLGSFYLGRLVDPKTRETLPEMLLYDAKDLTTHAVCVGMTGSGKTGLCVSLLEEAAIDGIPVIAIDPKGDLGNLMLSFPTLRPRDFAPWIDEGEALRKGKTPQEYAVQVAELWRNGLAEWDQDEERIARLREAADFAIYTPGSTAGLPLSILKSFAAPPPELVEDEDAFRERVQAAASGIVTLLGMEADPLRSREHILVSNLLDRAWREGQELGIADLIRSIQSPPFDRLGVFELDSFYPAEERFKLAMSLNNLLASPGFSAWMEGEPLDVGRLLWTAEGKPRVSIISIAHLSDAQRMFLVTLLLNEVIAWMRSQSGTTSLRAVLYMDEVFGFLPPTANPPSKTPMLTLLKQARAFGLGCVLATQNPVDLDYKALSNAGTWLLGRLQTERDKARVLDGLEGATGASGHSFDRQAVEATLSGLDSRMFLMNNVHEDAPVLFHTRWAMSYLRGPLTRNHIRTLMSDRKAANKEASKTAIARRAPATATDEVERSPERPSLSPGVEERFLPLAGVAGRDERVLYRPALLGAARVHFVSSPHDLDLWQEASLLAPVDNDTDDPWSDADDFAGDPDNLDSTPVETSRFGELPGVANKKKSYTTWRRLLKDHLYRTREVVIWKCKALKQVSMPGCSEGEFRVQLTQVAREQRDLKIEKLRKRYGPKIKRMEDRILRAQQKVEREAAQYGQQKMQTAISFGSTLLGAIFGRKAASVGTVGRAATAARGVGRAAREKGDIARAKESLETLKPQLQALEEEFQEETEQLREEFEVDALELTERRFKPRKSDIDVRKVVLSWTPWRVDRDGIAEPLFIVASNRRSRPLRLVLLLVLLAAIWAVDRYFDPLERSTPKTSASAETTAEVGGADAIAEAFAARRSGVMVEARAHVERLLSDDNEGSRHQRFIVRLASGKTALIAHNLDLAPRVPAAQGDVLRFRGQYEWNEKGGVIHWTHHDPDGRREGGWIRHKGRLYK